MTKIIVLTGFFGSGKTTLINHIIKTSPFKIGIIENDLAEINIDGKILNLSDSNIEVISNACICCTGSKHLTQSIDMLLKKYDNLEYIFIETTGLANPLKLKDTLTHALIKYDIPVLGVICIVDSKNTLDRKDIDEQIMQIAFSDYMLVSKSDLIDNDKYNKTIEYIRTINPTSKFTNIINGKMSVNDIISFLSESNNNSKTINKFESTSIHHEIKAISYESDYLLPMDEDDNNIFDRIKELINKYKLYRAKGILKFPYNDALTIFHGVQNDFEIDEVEVDKNTYFANKSSLVFIGKGITQEIINDCFKSFRYSFEYEFLK